MRRKDRQLSDSESYKILENGEYGILSTVSSENEPYGVPVNYYVLNKKIYFHCALLGMKIDNIHYNSRVSFCIVGETEILPDQCGSKYESCIINGLAVEVYGEEKETALKGLIEKYSANYIDEGLKIIERLKDKTRVFNIKIDEITGKASK